MSSGTFKINRQAALLLSKILFLHDSNPSFSEATKVQVRALTLDINSFLLGTSMSVPVASSGEKESHLVSGYKLVKLPAISEMIDHEDTVTSYYFVKRGKHVDFYVNDIAEMSDVTHIRRIDDHIDIVSGNECATYSFEKLPKSWKALLKSNTSYAISPPVDYLHLSNDSS